MKPALCGLFVLLVGAPARGQLGEPPDVVHAPTTYVRQLGASHFPAGEAALGDSGRVAHVLRSGAVLVAGTTFGSLGEAHAGSSVLPDVFLARFDPLGNLQWIRQLGAVTAPMIPALHGDPGGPGGDASKSDVAEDLAVAADGSIYVTGSTAGSLGETNGGFGGDAFLAKFDRDGALLWVRQIGLETAALIVPPAGATEWGDASLSDAGTSVMVDASGGVVVAGHAGWALGEDNAGNSDHFVARFSADGQFQWLRQMGAVSSAPVSFDSFGVDYSVEVAAHPSGSIVVACSGNKVFGTLVVEYVTLLTLDAQGEPLASQGLPGATRTTARGLAIAPSGRIFLAGETQGSLGEPNAGLDTKDAYVASFDADLDLEWVRQIGQTAVADFGLLDASNDELVGGLRLDLAGDLTLAGSTLGSLNEPSAGPNDVFTAKLRSSDGELLWVRQIGATTSALHPLDAAGSDTVGLRGLGLGARGVIAITGATNGNLGEPLAGSVDVFVMRLTPNGTL